MAESASKQLLSALTEGHEKGTSKGAIKKSSKATQGKSKNQGSSRHQRVVSGGQTVTSSSSTKRKQNVQLRLELHNH